MSAAGRGAVRGHDSAHDRLLPGGVSATGRVSSLRLVCGGRRRLARLLLHSARRSLQRTWRRRRVALHGEHLLVFPAAQPRWLGDGDEPSAASILLERSQELSLPGHASRSARRWRGTEGRASARWRDALQDGCVLGCGSSRGSARRDRAPHGRLLSEQYLRGAHLLPLMAYPLTGTVIAAAWACLAVACTPSAGVDAGLDAGTDVDAAPAPGSFGAPCGSPGLTPCSSPFACHFDSHLCDAPSCPSAMDSECPDGFICVGHPMAALCVKPCVMNADCPAPSWFQCGWSHLNMSDPRLACAGPGDYINPGPLPRDGG